jgi:hypothetical protein
LLGLTVLSEFDTHPPTGGFFLWAEINKCITNLYVMAALKESYTTNTFNQELLQCVALSFYIKNKNATNRDFFEYIENFAEDKDPDDILSSVKADYSIRNNLGVYHTKHKSGTSWIRSSIDIARFLIQKLSLTTNFEIHHQNSKFGRLIKDECVKKIVEALDTKNISNKPDVYNPTDMWIVNKNYEQSIRDDLSSHIINEEANILGNYISNKNTYKSIINRYYISKKLYQISLKKSGTAELIIDESYKDIKKASPINIKYKIIGSMMNYESNKIHIDSYTKFVFAFDEVLQEGNRSKTLKFIEDLVDIKKLNYKDEVLQPNLVFHLNYDGVDIEGGGIDKWKLDTPGDTFNMQKIGGTAWSGGLNTNGVHQILENYPRYSPIFAEVKAKRREAYDDISKDITPTVASILSRNEIIYKKDDLKKIRDSLLNTNQYIHFLVKSIQILSRDFRGIKELYGINSKETLTLTSTVKLDKYFMTKNKDNVLTWENIKVTVTNLKRGQTAVPLRVSTQTKKGDTVIPYVLTTNRIDEKIKPGYYVFVIDGKAKIKAGTKVESIDTKNKTITLTKPLEKGSNDKLKLFILDPYVTNIVSAEDLSKIKGNETKTIKYLEEKYSKLQAFYMFMRGGPATINEILKKQIVLTIYGLVSKKGGKLFDPDVYDEVKNKIFSKNALSKYVIPPFIIVGD